MNPRAIKEAHVKRIGLLLAVVVMFAAGLNAKNHNYDDKLEQLRKSRPNDTVRVIILSTDRNSIEKHSGKVAKLVHRFKYFPGAVVELRAKDVEKLDDSSFIALSLDAKVNGKNAVDGLEPPNSSSGGLAARQKYSAAGAGIGVAIIDSGIAVHPDIQNVVKTVDFTGGPNVQTDPYGHGTHVAGIIGGSGQSSQGLYAGIAPSARLINLRVLDSNGIGPTSSVIDAIEWAIANRNAPGDDGNSMNIRVINISLGHEPYESASTDPLAVMCRMAVQAGIVVVVSAGNHGKDVNGKTIWGTITSPGTEPSVITVGAMSTWGTPWRVDDVEASYSSNGPTIDGLVKPDIAAPGSRIVGPMSPGNYIAATNPGIQVGTGYMKLSGTSMAAPVVAGATAMMLSVTPDLTPNAVKAMLMYTAEKKGVLLGVGAGEVNIVGAMDLATSVNPNAATGQYWLTSNTALATPYDVINGYPAVWGQTIVWGGKRYGGRRDFMAYYRPMFAKTILWGDTIVWDATIVWDETILWRDTFVSGQTIVWAESLVWAETIVWAESILWDEL